uniref:ShKT domain-containing protein n=1 Tax=Panagrolaimus superbus TaxID=310955 RepID=A0A914Y926_9BILA
MKTVCLILISVIIGCNAQCDSGNFPITGAQCVPGICSGCLNGVCCGPDGTGAIGTTGTGTTIFGATVSTTFASLTTAPGCIGPCFDNACPASYTCNTVTQQCCSAQTTSSPITSCRDLIGPKGYSDCPRLASLCNSTTYYDIMTQQCPRTCGRCNSSVLPSTNPSSTNCVDMAKANGVSDCPQLAYLCNNPVYRTIMTQQCPRTCGRCSSSLTG